MALLSNINSQDRSAALRFANNALESLEAVHVKWILWDETGSAATALQLVNRRLRPLVALLGDATADQYAVAHDLGVIAVQLVGIE